MISLLQHFVKRRKNSKKPLPNKKFVIGLYCYYKVYEVSMKYSNVKKGIFIERPNRFTAKVEIDGKTETVHVKNTGRCRELLIPGAIVYLTKSDNPERKTAYDLVAVEKERENKTPLLVNMDSQIPNDVVEEWLKKSKEKRG